MGDLFGGPFFHAPVPPACRGTMGGVMTAPVIPVVPLWRLAVPPCPVGSMSLDSQSPTVPCESSSFATRWEACHLILSCLRLLANQVPLPPGGKHVTGFADPGAPYESSSFATPAVRWGGKRKAPLNFSFPLEGKCHVVAKGCTRLNILMKLTIVLLGLTSPHLEVLCRTSTGDYKAPLCCELLMKGLLFRALFCPRLRGKSGAAG